MLKHLLLPLGVAAFLASAGPAAAQAFPDGPGKDILEKKCSTCHAPEQVTTFGRSAEEWHEVVINMIDLGAELNEEETNVLVEYLTKNWPLKGATPPAGTPTEPPTDKPAEPPTEKPAEQPAPQAAPAGMAPVPSHRPQVSIREFNTPARPHDALAASDGSIWYTADAANVVGRVDPATGQVKEFPLKTPASGPHDLTEDKEGNIWYTGHAQGLIGKIDPKTGTVTEYPMPDANARDPHSLTFDQSGNLWFTITGANMVGRLNPATGDLALRNSPTSKSAPYVIVAGAKGVPYFVEFGANKIASIDPSNFTIREWTLPNEATRPRGLTLDAQGNVYYSDYARGYIGRLDPVSGKVQEWQSPGGPKSQPYGMAFTGGRVWYVESGLQPNVLVMFDPATETFQTTPLPSAGGIVRNLSVTRDGNLALALGGANKVGLAEIRK